MSGNIIQLNEQQIHTELKDLVKKSIEETLNSFLDEEANRLVNAERYARDEILSSIFKKDLLCGIGGMLYDTFLYVCEWVSSELCVFLLSIEQGENRILMF